MQPQESLNTNEKISETSGFIPKFDASAPYNGMYANEAEFQAAEAAYKIDTNTISFAEDGPAYPMATMEDVAAMDSAIEVSAETIPDSETSVELAEVTEQTAETDTSLTTEVALQETDENVIDVEAKEVFVDPESDNGTEDIAKLIEDNNEITVGQEKLTFTPKLKELAKGVLAAIDQLLTHPEAELPEEVDWRPYIMSEPEYDDSYDYILLQKLLRAQYRRRRRIHLLGKYPNLADIIAATPMTPPPQTPEGNAKTANDNPEADNGTTAELTPKEPLKIEMDKLKLEYSDTTPPALTYEPTPQQSPGQGEAPRITQQ